MRILSTVVVAAFLANRLAAQTPAPIASSSSGGGTVGGVQSSITGLGAQSQALNMNTNLIDNVTDPAAAQDAATKNYVDNKVNGIQWKPGVALATVAGLPAYVYANGASGVGASLTEVGFGALSVDGVAVTSGQRILVKNETAGNQPYNGIYTVTATGGGAASYVLTRAVDYNQTSEIEAGDAVFVALGNTLGLTSWVQTTTGAITVGTTNIVFAQIAADIQLPVPVASGGTAGTTAATARSNLSAAASGVNADITSETALTTITSAVNVSSMTLSTGAAQGIGGSGQYGKTCIQVAWGDYLGNVSTALGLTMSVNGSSTTSTTVNTIYFTTATANGGALAQKGDKFKITCEYTLAADGNTKVPMIRVSGAAGANPAILSQDSNLANNKGSEIYATFTKNGASTQIYGGMGNAGTTSSNFQTIAGSAPTLSLTDTAAINFNCACNATAAAGDCSFVQMSVEYCPGP